MIVSQLVVEDYIQYKLPSLFIGTSKCSRHCINCQNEKLRHTGIEVDNFRLINLYLNNPLTKAITFGGLDPLDTFEEVLSFYEEFRKISREPVVIYTGYREEEVSDKIALLVPFGGKLIVKFGAYIEGHERHYDEVLGVWLISDNQYAKEF